MSNGRKWRTLVRIISFDRHNGQTGCYAVLPAWNWRVAVYIPSLPPNFDPAEERYYAMVVLGEDDWQDLDPEWCE